MSNNIWAAALYMSGAIASFSMMAIAGRYISWELDTFEIMTYRSVVGFAIMVTFITLSGKWSLIPTQKLGTHIIRNAFHFSGQNLWFFAITAAPLAQVFALEFTSPLWVLLLSPLFLNERLTSLRVLAGLLGFVGILFVARPFSDEISIGVMTAALSAIGFAGSIIFTKHLTKSEKTVTILFYLTAIQFVFGLLCAGIDGDIALPSFASLGWVVVIGGAGLLAHFCLTTALTLAPATVVVPIDFIRLPVIAIIGMILFEEGIDIYVFIGAFLIVSGNYANLWYESRHRES